MSQFTVWPLVVEFEQREVELPLMDLIIFLLCLFSTLVIQLFLGISEISQDSLVNCIHFPQWAHKRTAFPGLLAVGLGPCDSVLVSGVWAGL